MNNKELYYLQDSRSYVGNDILFWADAGGYTTNVSKAEKFDKEKVIEMHNSRITDIPWPVKYIDEKTRPAVDMQYVDIQTALHGTGITLAQPEKPKREKYKCEDCGQFVTEEEYSSRIYAGHPCRNCEDDL